jgi:hypothetical protein
MGTRWTPQIFPSYRPPRAGWVIHTMPAFVPEELRRAWTSRKPQSNRNGIAALQEMTDFLRFNKVAVTKEMLVQMQQQADGEWCAAEPSRCPRTAGTALVRRVAEESTATVSRAVAQSQGFVKKAAPRRRRGCCGG